MLNIYLFCAVTILINLHGASLNDSYLNYLENHLHRTIRQAIVEECASPTIPNGEINILKRSSTAEGNFLVLNITCDSNYILQPSNNNLISCFNGFWSVVELPQCKRCVKLSEIKNMGNPANLQLICPESSFERTINTECGQRLDNTHHLFVINGSKAKFVEFPWHIGIYKKDLNNLEEYEYKCGGSIINEKTILTVAHCFTDAFGKLTVPAEYYAAAGKYHREYNSDQGSTQKRKIVETHLNSNYKGELSNFGWDIAVLFVDKPFEITIFVQPVCIDWKTLFNIERLSPNTYGEVPGWGITENNPNKPASELQVLKVPFIGAKQCTGLVPDTFIKYITHDKFCAGYMNGSSVCDGDSGGGLVFKKQDKDKTKYYIKGLVSVGVLVDEMLCNSYSTYTNVSEYISFIEERIKNNDISTNTSTSAFRTTTPLPETSEQSTPTETIVYCKTPNNETAKCISIYDCKTFVNALQNSPTTDALNFMRDSICGKQDENKVCCGSAINYLSVIHSNPVTTKPIKHRNLNLLPKKGICGRQTRVRKGRTAGGIFADLYDYPWMALLEYGTPEKSAGFLCAGFLINERYVMTAAHCAMKMRSADSAQVFRVRLGEYDIDMGIDCINSNCGDQPLNVDIEEMVVHPAYKRGGSTSDIALLRLAQNISYTDFIKPICLPTNGEMSLPGRQIFAAGWSQTEFGYANSVKLKKSLFIISQEECINSYKNKAEIFSTHICARDEYGNGDCIGDTMGPLMSTYTNSRDIYAEGVLLSFGKSFCESSKPSVATRVTSHMQWILAAIRP